MVRTREFTKRSKFKLSRFYNPQTTEVYRSLWFTNQNRFLFPLDIDFHDKPLETSIGMSLEVARKVEKKYPDQFLWKLSGRGVHGISLLDTAVTPGLDVYRQKYSDIQLLRSAAGNIGKSTFGVDMDVYNSRSMIRSMGSINFKSHLWNIPLDLSWTVEEVIKKGQVPNIDDWILPTFNMSLPISGITKLPPFRYKGVNINLNRHIDVRDFPPCMQTLMSLPKVSFAHRKILIPFLRDMGWSIEKIYEMLEIQFGITKKNHVLEGREIERYFQVQYPTPGCRYIKGLGMCPSSCGRRYPLNIDGD